MLLRLLLLLKQLVLLLLLLILLLMLVLLVLLLAGLLVFVSRDLLIVRQSTGVHVVVLSAVRYPVPLTRCLRDRGHGLHSTLVILIHPLLGSRVAQ